jgi:hypothetical protein
MLCYCYDSGIASHWDRHITHFYRTLVGRDFKVLPVNREGRLYENNVKVDLRKLCYDVKTCSPVPRCGEHSMG